MAQMTATEVRNNFSDVVNRAYYTGEHTIIGRGAKRLAAIIPIEDYDAMEEMEDLYAARAIDEARADPINQGPAMSIEEVRAELGL